MQFLRGLSVTAKMLQLKTVAWSIVSRACHVMQKELFSSAKCISLGYLYQKTQKQISRMQWKVFISQLQAKKLMTLYGSDFQLQAGWALLGLNVALLL